MNEFRDHVGGNRVGDAVGIPLSPAGELRRGKILSLAKTRARTIRRRRTATRIAATLCGAVAIAVVVRMQSHQIVPSPVAHVAPVTMPVTLPTPIVSIPPIHISRPPQEIIVTLLHTDDTLVGKLAIRPVFPAWERLNDEQFLRTLADAGKPAGLAYVEGRAMVLYREPGKN